MRKIAGEARPRVMVGYGVDRDRTRMTELRSPVNGAVELEEQETRTPSRGIKVVNGVQGGRTEEAIPPIRTPVFGGVERLIEEIVVIEGDAARAVRHAMSREPAQFQVVSRVFPRLGKANEKRPFQLRQQ